MIPTIAAVALGCGWLSALSTARVSSRPGAGVAPASAQTTRSAPAAEELDINPAPKINSRQSRHRGRLFAEDHRRAPPSQQAGFGHKNIIPRSTSDKIKEKITAKQPKATGMAPASPK